MGALEVVIGNPCVEVVDVVQPDVAGKELQDLRQLEVGAAAQCGLPVAPVIGALPVGVFELVLNIKEPDPDRAGEQRRGCPDQ